MARDPIRGEPPLLDAERALRFARDAVAALEAPLDEETYWTHRRKLRLQGEVAIDALRVALDVTIDTGDPRILSALFEAADNAAAEASHRHDELDFAYAAAALVPNVAPISNRVRECATSPSIWMRALTAKALGPRALRALRGKGDEVDAEAAGIVTALTKDPNGTVRARAREALGGMAPPAWATFFPRDPLATRPAKEAATLRGALDRAAAALENDVRLNPTPLAEAVRDLPDDLAVPFLEAWLDAGDTQPGASSIEIVDRWVRAEGAAARAAAWVTKQAAREDGDKWCAWNAPATIGARVARLPEPDATSICLAVAARLAALDEDNTLTAHLVENLLTAAWPPGADPTPLLEHALGAPLERADEPGSGTADPDAATAAVSRFCKLALAERPSFTRIVEPLVDAVCAGFPGRWALLAHAIRERLWTLSHPRLRARAERALGSSGDDEALGEALAYLTQGGHDPKRDPPVATILARAAADDRLVGALLSDHELMHATLAPLRARFTAGELAPAAALRVARRFVHGAGAEALSPDEWRIIRSAREKVDTINELLSACDALPAAAAWTPEDHAFVERVIDRHGDDELTARRLALALEQRAAPELIPICEKLVSKAPPSAAKSAGRVLQVCRGERKSLWAT